ncbi:MAG TPA: hypothetical protein VK694_05940 [Verrucomicrobiae bacterium]|nr:hypothetical protein [Verrucomicrobiae bacterium]
MSIETLADERVAENARDVLRLDMVGEVARFTVALEGMLDPEPIAIDRFTDADIPEWAADGGEYPAGTEVILIDDSPSFALHEIMADSHRM